MEENTCTDKEEKVERIVSASERIKLLKEQ